MSEMQSLRLEFLWIASEVGAEYIITKDKKHLLSLKNYRGIPIGTPRDFFKWVKKMYPRAQPNW
jgi:predicted nucleic acid-binding protein